MNKKQDICSGIHHMYKLKTGPQMMTSTECFKDGGKKQYKRYTPRYAQRYEDKELFEHELALVASELKQLLSK